MPDASEWGVAIGIILVVIIVVAVVGCTAQSPGVVIPYEYVLAQRRMLSDSKSVNWQHADRLAKYHLGMNDYALSRYPHVQTPCKCGSKSDEVATILKQSYPMLPQKCCEGLAGRHAETCDQLSSSYHKDACKMTSAKGALVSELVAKGMPPKIAMEVCDLYNYMLENNLKLKDDEVHFGNAAANTILDDVRIGQYVGNSVHMQLAQTTDVSGATQVLKDHFESIGKRASVLAGMYIQIANAIDAVSKEEAYQSRLDLAKAVLAKAELENELMAEFGTSLNLDDIEKISRVASDAWHAKQHFGHVYTSLHGAGYPGVYSKTVPGGGLKASGADLVVRMSAEDVVRYAKYEADLAAGRVPDSGYAQEHAAIKASLDAGKTLFGHASESLHGASYPGVYNSTALGGKVLSSSADLVSRMSPQDIAMYAKYEADLAAGRAVDPKYAQQHAAIKAGLGQSFGRSKKYGHSKQHEMNRKLQFGHSWSSLHHAMYPNVYQAVAPGGKVKASTKDLLSQLSADDIAMYAKYEADSAAGRQVNAAYAQKHAQIKEALREGQSLSDATSGIEPSFGRLRQPHELLMQPPIMTSFGAPCHHVSTSHALNMGIPLEILMDRGTRAMAGPEQKRFDDLKEIQKKMRMTPNDEKVLHEVLSSSKNTEEVTAALQRYFGNVLSSSTLKVLAGSHVNVHKTVARCIQENPEHGNKCITQSLATKTIILAKATAYLMRVLKHRFSEENIREIASYLSMLYKWT